MKATTGGNFKPVPLPEPQTTFARCYSVIDIGTVQESYMNKPKKPMRKIYITWELPTLLAVFNEEKGKQPFVVGVELTASTSENSNLAKIVSAWRNKPFTLEEQKGFDPSIMIGKPALISFVHKRKKKYLTQEIKDVTNENTMLTFNTISQVPKDMSCPKNINGYFNWDWDKVAVEGFNKEEFEKIPKWLQRRISMSEEFAKYAGDYKVEKSDDQSEVASVDPEQGNIKTVSDQW